jgi:hypothetical protein
MALGEGASSTLGDGDEDGERWPLQYAIRPSCCVAMAVSVEFEANLVAASMTYHIEVSRGADVVHVVTHL